MSNDWLAVGVVAQAQIGGAPEQAAPSAAPVRAAGMPGAPGTTVQPGSTPASPGGAAPSAAPSSMMLWLMLAMFAVIMLPALMGGRKEKKRRAEMMSALKKNDRVQTLGGIVGTVSEISETEVVLKVEDGRIRFAKSAIQGVVKPATGPAGANLEAKDPKAVSV